MIQRRSGQTLAGLIVLACAAQAALAQRNTFEPAVVFKVGYTDNVEFANASQSSDTWFHTSVVLPVKREWNTGSFEFRYRPSLLQYTTGEQFDHDDHNVRATLEHEPTAVSRIRFDTVLSRTQFASTDLDDFDEALFIGRRTERDIARVGFAYRRAAGQRWLWNFSVGAKTVKHSEIGGFVGSTLYQIEDRDDQTATVGFERDISRRASAGLEYGYRHSKLDLNGDEDTNSLAMVVKQDLGRQTSLSYRLGGFRSSGRAADGPGADDERSGLLGGLDFVRRYRSVQLNMNVTHSPESGSDLAGVASVTRAGVSVSPLRVKRWNWKVLSGYGRRDPADATLQTDTVRTLGASVEFLIYQGQGIRLDYTVRDQSRRGDPSAPDPSAFNIALGYIWYPLKKTTLGGK